MGGIAALQNLHISSTTKHYIQQPVYSPSYVLYYATPFIINSALQ
jgi:hypothetical protein